ncbi:MAG TPA: YbhB/YbcL family Raf kinase inhibitor-like protein [Terriglobales bacterium]|nr:YbhB/YbcL family Raf kinase inhibitor-like protein [Terriglobales bacterium]
MVRARRAAWLLAGAAALAAVAASGYSADSQAGAKNGGGATMKMESKSFPAGGDIPRRFTCDGENLSPALSWSAPPKGTQSMALITDDPDAPGGTFVHWVLYNLPANTHELPEGLPASADLPSGGRQGTNDFRRLGYGGPCPPAGKPHRYFFRLFALDRKLDLRSGAGRSDLDQAMKGSILAQGEVMGRYQRR